MSRKIHKFDNGISVYDDHLLDIQRERYKEHNVHEAEEEPIFLEALSGVQENGHFVNVGAAIGYYAILARKKRPDIHVTVYEPLKLHRKYLAENFKLNHLRSGSISVYKEAVSPLTGYVGFVPRNYGSVVDANDQKIDDLERFIRWTRNEIVKSIDVEAVLKRAGGKIDLLQMDIQGTENELLHSAREVLDAQRIKMLIIGTHSNEKHLDCVSILESCGYKIVVNCFETNLQPDGILYAQL